MVFYQQVEHLFITAALCLAACAPSAGALPVGKFNLQNVRRDALCVSEGTVEGLDPFHWMVNVPNVRGALGTESPQIAQLEFVYKGPTAEQRALGSGLPRQQLGLKLRAQDACNVLYVMWRLAPETQLVVSRKRNLGEHTSGRCANRGYQNIRGTYSTPLPITLPGSRHRLRAELLDDNLRAYADDILVWEGDVSDAIADLEGPIGIRTDNVVVEMTLSSAPFSHLPQCSAREEDGSR